MAERGAPVHHGDVFGKHGLRGPVAHHVDHPWFLHVPRHPLLVLAGGNKLLMYLLSLLAYFRPSKLFIRNYVFLRPVIYHANITLSRGEKPNEYKVLVFLKKEETRFDAVTASGFLAALGVNVRGAVCMYRPPVAEGSTTCACQASSRLVGLHRPAGSLVSLVHPRGLLPYPVFPGRNRVPAVSGVWRGRKNFCIISFLFSAKTLSFYSFRSH